jgi:hypothetical protein
MCQRYRELTDSAFALIDLSASSHNATLALSAGQTTLNESRSRVNEVRNLAACGLMFAQIEFFRKINTVSEA